MKSLWELISGITMGGFVVTVIVMVILVLANIAVADESVAVRPAELGEQDRGMNYPTDPTLAAPVVTGMDFIEGPSWEELMDEEAHYECLKYNEKIAYTRAYVEKRMKQTPSVAYIYEDLLESLVEKDCDD